MCDLRNQFRVLKLKCFFYLDQITCLIAEWLFLKKPKVEFFHAIAVHSVFGEGWGLGTGGAEGGVGGGSEWVKNVQLTGRPSSVGGGGGRERKNVQNIVRMMLRKRISRAWRLFRNKSQIKKIILGLITSPQPPQ